MLERGKIRSRLAVAFALGVVSIGTPLFAQTIAPAQTARQATRGGAARSRSPGNMVSAGVAATLNFKNAAAAGVKITETARPSSIRAQLLADSISTLFDQLNQLIAIFDNLLRARAGTPPALPPSTSTPAGGTGGVRGGGSRR